MGDRVSICFKNGDEESVTLFSHWGGKEFVRTAKVYVAELQNQKGSCTPLNRLEPNTVMVDFIRFITKDIQRVDSNYYLGKDEFDGDNSDNGHFRIKLG